MRYANSSGFVADRHPVLEPVSDDADIASSYRGTAIGDLLASHNLGRALRVTPAAGLAILTCIDHRVSLDVPEYFAFQLRTAGANPRPILSNVAYLVSVVGIRSICVVMPSQSFMPGDCSVLGSMADHLIAHEGWVASKARRQEQLFHTMFGVPDPILTAVGHAEFLARRFPSCLVAPLLYQIDDGSLVQIHDIPSNNKESQSCESRSERRTSNGAMRWPSTRSVGSREV